MRSEDIVVAEVYVKGATAVAQTKWSERVSMMITLDQLGSEVRKKRGGRRLKDIETKAGVSASTLSRIERGMTPDLPTVKKVAKWLGVNVRAAGGDETGIKSEQDLERAVEVYLRADKKLSEDAARTIAQTVRKVMEWQVAENKGSGGGP